MRIAHVVTLISPDGAFGGPVRVALSQAEALIAAGHDVHVYAATLGFDAVPERIGTVPVHLYSSKKLVKYKGYAALYSPDLPKALRNDLEFFDIVHLHQSRDMVMIPAGLETIRSGTPYVLQTHGMIRKTKNLLFNLIDIFATRRILDAAAYVFCLTEDEERDLRSMCPTVTPISQLTNGLSDDLFEERAGANGSDIDVLFLARLAPRKRPEVFATAAATLLGRIAGVKFSLVGPDEGQAAEVQRIISSSEDSARLVYEGALSPDRTAARMRQADLYVLPALDEPFGLTVLEAMAVGLPVIVTNECGLAPAIEQASAGLVVDASEEALANAIERLCRNDDERLRMGKNARQLARRDYGMSPIVDRLVAEYERAQRRGQ